MQVVLLAGGLATRLRPITEKIPKGMVEIAGKPFLEHQLELLKRNGLREIILCVGYLGEMVEAYFGDGGRWGVSIQYAYDGKTLVGTGGAIKRAEPLLRDAFMVLYGDSYLDIPYQKIVEDFRRRDALGLMTVYRNEGKLDRSNVVFKDGKLLVYDKRNPMPEMRYIDYGLSILKKSIMADVPNDVPVDLADILTRLAANGQLAGYEVHNRFYEIGSQSALDEFKHFIEGKAEDDGNQGHILGS